MTRRHLTNLLGGLGFLLVVGAVLGAVLWRAMQ